MLFSQFWNQAKWELWIRFKGDFRDQAKYFHSVQIFKIINLLGIMCISHFPMNNPIWKSTSFVLKSHFFEVQKTVYLAIWITQFSNAYDDFYCPSWRSIYQHCTPLKTYQYSPEMFRSSLFEMLQGHYSPRLVWRDNHTGHNLCWTHCFHSPLFLLWSGKNQLSILSLKWILFHHNDEISHKTDQTLKLRAIVLNDFFEGSAVDKTSQIFHFI